jgi:hypothetical protein
MEWVGLVEFKNLYTLVLIQRLGGGYMVSGITHYADPPACYEATIPPLRKRTFSTLARRNCSKWWMALGSLEHRPKSGLL